MIIQDISTQKKKMGKKKDKKQEYTTGADQTPATSSGGQVAAAPAQDVDAEIVTVTINTVDGRDWEVEHEDGVPEGVLYYYVQPVTGGHTLPRILLSVFGVLPSALVPSPLRIIHWASTIGSLSGTS